MTVLKTVANGDNLVALCYRTNPWNPPASLFVSFTVADKINRKIGAPAGVSVDVKEFKEKVKVFTPEGKFCHHWPSGKA